MVLSLGKFFRACNSSKTLNLTELNDQKYYIDFTEVRGSDLVLAKTSVIAPQSNQGKILLIHVIFEIKMTGKSGARKVVLIPTTVSLLDLDQVLNPSMNGWHGYLNNGGIRDGIHCSHQAN